MRRRLLALVSASVLGSTLVAPTAAHAGGDPTIVRTYQGGFACTSSEQVRAVHRWPHGGGPGLEAFGKDPSAAPRSPVSYEFSLWPDGDPSAARTLTAPSSIGHPGGVALPTELVDGTTYAWQVRLHAAGTSPWSPACRFRVDDTVPAAPVVRSPNFPERTWGRPGVVGRFTFRPTGDRQDVVAYSYSWGANTMPACGTTGPAGEYVCPEPWIGEGRVRADRVGGPATVDIPAIGDLTQTLTVRAVDAAGNWSDGTTYQLWVTPTAPSVTAAPDCAGDSQLGFTPDRHLHDVIAWEYGFGLGDPTDVRRIAAEADGTGGVTLDVAPGEVVAVRSVGASGFLSSWWFVDADPRPTVSSATYPRDATAGGIGVAGSFDLYTSFPAPEVSVFRYRFGSARERRVTPGLGTATVSWTPHVAGPTTLQVSGRTAEGWTCATDYSFTVAG